MLIYAFYALFGISELMHEANFLSQLYSYASSLPMYFARKAAIAAPINGETR